MIRWVLELIVFRKAGGVAKKKQKKEKKRKKRVLERVPRNTPVRAGSEREKGGGSGRARGGERDRDRE